MLTFMGATDIDGGVTYLRQEVLPILTAQHGYRGVTASGNRSTNVFGILSLWDTEEDRASSDSALGKARTEAVKIVGGDLTVENLEQMVGEVVKPITVGCSLFVTRVSMDPSKVDENVAFFKSDVLPRIVASPGFCAVRHMINRQSGKGLVGTVWASEAARATGADDAKSRRGEATERGVTFDDITFREILFADLR